MASAVREAMELVQRTLEEGLIFFSKGACTSPQPPSQHDVVVALNSIEEIARSCDPEDFAIAIEHSKVYVLACALAVEPLLYALPEESGASLQQTFVKVRAAALEAIADTVKAVAQSRRKPDPTTYAGLDLLEALLSHIAAPMTFEALRQQAAQCLFFLTTTVPQRLPTNFIQAVVQCAVIEPAAQVRAAILCVVRELAERNVAAVQLETATFFKLLEVDDSPDVRILAAEVLTVATDETSAAADPAPAVTALRRRLESFNEASDTAEGAAVAALLRKLLEVNPHDTFPEFCRQRLERALLHAAVVSFSHDLLAALRFAVDRCPPALRLGQQLLSNFQAFSGLLKIVLDCHGVADSSHGAQPQLCGVEASATVALLLAQSPAHRQHLKRELHAFPMWTTALKDSVLHFLNATSLDSFTDIELIDFSNTRLNDPNLVEWNEQERPHRASIHHIFSAQESRFAEGAMLTQPAPSHPYLLEAEQRRKSKLTFVLLSYAVHATLADDLAANPANPNAFAAAAQNPASVAASMRQAYRDQQGETPTGARAGSAGPAPRFPTPRAPQGAQSQARREAVTPAEKQELAYAYDRFDSSFKLTRQFAKYYIQSEARQPVYEPTADGFVVRQQQLRNPWGPIVKKQQAKSWAVKDLKEGDLFYFAVPFNELSRSSIECVLERLRRHAAAMKRTFVTTPHTARGRRWLVYDQIHNVLPGIEELLRTVQDLLGDYGDENVRFPVFLFREKEMHLGERALHCGNLVEVVDQVSFYFSQNPAEIFGAPDDAAAITRLEERLRELAESGVKAPAVDSDHEGGHGGLSSDSEED
jgi:hypothetical protein